MRHLSNWEVLKIEHLAGLRRGLEVPRVPCRAGCFHEGGPVFGMSKRVFHRLQALCLHIVSSGPLRSCALVEFQV